MATHHEKPKDLSIYTKAYFASGCFWCVEAIFQSVNGVAEVISGYSGGGQDNPTYQMVGAGFTDHAESVEVYYDPNRVSYETLVDVFFLSHDPTQLNGQGPDKGRQYRSIAFYQNNHEKKVIENYIRTLEENKTYNSPIVTQVVLFKKFWKAEEYHQDYKEKNPQNPYIKTVSTPRLNRYKELFDRKNVKVNE
ncbi:peptide methionine sulfoxide reductase MsrA [Elysia marginata]|uniref:peptide-methionine (S)-S-oxide reductase n=1 Tax=Elysia marginata TaxID=1093978 RepID=A0AAV4FGY7_9GAST|nr:peptide methionine sulfoxide reductase MsrA [Elysia marginata]